MTVPRSENSNRRETRITISTEDGTARYVILTSSLHSINLQDRKILLVLGFKSHIFCSYLSNISIFIFQTILSCDV